MKHLITGGSGFLGNLIARRLLEQGETVAILDVWDDATRPREIAFWKCDIRDAGGVARAMAGVDVVHHNVALVPITKAGPEFLAVNVEGARIAAEAAARAGVRNFIYMSSSAIFGRPACPVTDATQPHPIEIYGRSKWEGEQAVRRVCAERGMPLIAIRPRTIVGQGRLGIFQILFEWIREGRNVYVIGDGNIRYQFIHALDLMDAYMLVLERGLPGAYNVGAERFGTLREGLEHLVEHAGTRSKVRGLPAAAAIAALRTLDAIGLSPLAPWHYLTYHKPFFFDVEPLLRLGWKPRYSNDEMLRESYDWFVAHGRGEAGADASPHRKAVRERLLKILKAFS